MGKIITTKGGRRVAAAQAELDALRVCVKTAEVEQLKVSCPWGLNAKIQNAIALRPGKIATRHQSGL